MAKRRKIEVFTAGCPRCTEAIELVNFLAGTEHFIKIRDMRDPADADAAAGYGIRRLPAIVIDGKLADRGAGRGPDEATLTKAILTGRGFTPASAENRLRARGRSLH